MKKCSIICLGILFFMQAKSQTIPKWKIDSLVNYYNQKNDSIYVVNFWSTWCGPCVEEIPYLQSISKKYAAKKVKLLLVSLDASKLYPKKLAAFAKAKGITASLVWLNESDADIFCPAVDSSWGGALPATIIVNNKTGYRKFHEEMFSRQEFEAELKKAINSKPVVQHFSIMMGTEPE